MSVFRIEGGHSVLGKMLDSSDSPSGSKIRAVEHATMLLQGNNAFLDTEGFSLFNSSGPAVLIADLVSCVDDILVTYPDSPFPVQ